MGVQLRLPGIEPDADKRRPAWCSPLPVRATDPCGVRLVRSVGAGRSGVNTSVTLPAPSAPQSFKLSIGVKVLSSFGRKTKCSLR